jgi:hypothetical protein
MFAQGEAPLTAAENTSQSRAFRGTDAKEFPYPSG